MEEMCINLVAGRKLHEAPLLVYPTYIRYSSETRAFGVFAATDIDPAHCKDPHACVGTYGGVVCTEWEPRCMEEVYSLPFGTLPRKTRSSDKTYVMATAERLNTQGGWQVNCPEGHHALGVR